MWKCLCCKVSLNRRLTVTSQPPAVAQQQAAILNLGIIKFENYDMEHAVVSIAGTYEERGRFFCAKKVKTNQDSYFAESPFFGDPEMVLFGVLDGHGLTGHHISQHVARRLPVRLAQNHVIISDPPQGLRDCFISIDAELAHPSPDCLFNPVLSGSTACVVYVHSMEIFVANCGDSRCMLGRINNDKIESVSLSRDHKPSIPEERERIEQSQGFVAPSPDWVDGPLRVWSKAEKLPGLAMSRSLGDRLAHSVGVIPDPEIQRHSLDLSTDRYLVIASDGVWDCVDSSEVFEVVSAQSTAFAAAQALCQLAEKRWVKLGECNDDITAIVIFFKPTTPL